jgi:hypothetical protein
MILIPMMWNLRTLIVVLSWRLGKRIPFSPVSWLIRNVEGVEKHWLIDYIQIFQILEFQSALTCKHFSPHQRRAVRLNLKPAAGEGNQRGGQVTG